MVTRLETIGYETLDELNETYKTKQPRCYIFEKEIRK